MNQATNGSRHATATARDLGTGPVLLSATSIVGDEVCNLKDEKLGTIQDIMLDLRNGKIRYAVLASGGFLGMGGRLFALPWRALKHDGEHKRFNLDIEIDRLKQAPGFDKDEWPNMADSTWNSSIESYYTTRADSPGI